MQLWPLPRGQGMDGLTRALTAAGALAPEAPCHWQVIAHRPAPRTVAFWALVPKHPQALAPTAQGEVPAPVCGTHGASTHGVRYFIVDLCWAGMAVFVDEGQERPMFDPASIVRLRYGSLCGWPAFKVSGTPGVIQCHSGREPLDSAPSRGVLLEVAFEGMDVEQHMQADTDHHDPAQPFVHHLVQHAVEGEKHQHAGDG